MKRLICSGHLFERIPPNYVEEVDTEETVEAQFNACYLA